MWIWGRGGNRKGSGKEWGYRIQNTDTRYRCRTQDMDIRASRASKGILYTIRHRHTCTCTQTEKSTHPHRCTHTEASTGSYMSANAYIPEQEGTAELHSLTCRLTQGLSKCRRKVVCDACTGHHMTQDDSDGSLEGAGFLCKTRMWGCWEERTEMSVSDPKKERMGLSQRKAPRGTEEGRKKQIPRTQQLLPSEEGWRLRIQPG